MLYIIGAGVVVISVLGGFLMEEGNLSVLFQPAEFVIIGGALIGSFLIASPMKVVRLVVKDLSGVLKTKSQTKQGYLGLLHLLYKLFSKIRKEGLVSVEADIENPASSPVFKQYGIGPHNKEIVDFICDNMKVIITTNVPAHELDSLMDLEIETRQDESLIPSKSVAKLADALPGLGIVAAVIGVVLTMGKIDQPPSVLGHSIGAALVGTFMGVLLSYGFMAPLASNLEHRAKEGEIEFQVVKVAIVSFVGGAAPQIAVEFGRRAIPGKECPTFSELERQVKMK
ncbi:MAG: flagellar motor stator protein MotA [Nitrospiraceae bacterium]|nr:flagellar motor stator protein MotA [Nitrospiraceae bacterium]